jgi:hypothetical protein
MIISIDTSKQSEQEAWDIVKNAYSNEPCSCFRKIETFANYTDFEKGYSVALGVKLPKIKFKTVCWGTKECEECYCGGDRRKCDFYEDVRNGGK